MNDEQLVEYLRKMGMTCFVKYFYEFSDESLSSRYLIDLLRRKEGYTEGSCRTRVARPADHPDRPGQRCIAHNQ